MRTETRPRRTLAWGRKSCKELARWPAGAPAVEPGSPRRENPLAASEIARRRQRLYELFSEFFLQPLSPELLSRLADPESREAVGTLMGSEVELLCSSVLWQADADTVRAEYAALFVLPGSRQTHPFETCYREVKWNPSETRPGRMLGLVALQLQRTYVEWGMSTNLDADEFPDHAGVELRFMARLVESERLSRVGCGSASTASILRAEADFLARHILQWVPEWLDRVRDRARWPAYRVVATLLDRFLKSDRAALELGLHQWAT